VVLLRVLVTRTSVVETDSRHLGDARKWSREAKRAAAPSDGEGCRPWTGSTAVHLAARVSGNAKSESSMQNPSVMRPLNQLARDRTIEFVEGVWSLETMALKPGHESRISGLATNGHGRQEAAGLGRETTSHARDTETPFAPPADGRRESATSGSAPADACCTEPRCHGCKGEKPWHLASDHSRANGCPAKRNRRRTMMPHLRRKRVWGSEAVE